MDTIEAMRYYFQLVMVLVGVLAGIVAAFGPMICIARWILAPIDRAAKSRQAPARFSIGDFLCLFILIQIPLAAVSQLRDTDNERPLWMATTVVWILGTVIWFKGARTLSRAGVANGAHRFVYLGLVLPIVYYGVLPYTFLTCFGISIFFGNNIQGDGVGWAFVAWSLLSVSYFFKCEIHAMDAANCKARRDSRRGNCLDPSAA